MQNISNDSSVSWLLEGDAAIRWQVLRDLAHCPQRIWENERRRVATTGWGERLLKLQDAQGTWSHSLYGNPKWTCTTYTLLQLRDMGIPEVCAAARKGCQVLLDRGIDGDSTERGRSKTLAGLQNNDTCVVGMWLSLGTYFRLKDRKLETVAEYLLDEQMPDGGWNCRKNRGAVHSSFHTTLNVLDGIRGALANRVGPVSRLKAAESRAIEFMLVHRLFLSDKTGEVISEAFTKFSFPPRWHYDVLCGLDYLRSTNALSDERLQNAYDLLLARRRSGGRWMLQNKHPGKVFFDLEKTGQPSRWNTLRALRCLKARPEGATNR